MTPPQDNRSKAQFEALKAVGSVAQLVATLILIPMGAWALNRIVDYGERITKIEATRFTAEDGNRIEDRIRALERGVDRVLVKLGESPGIK